MKKAAAVLRQLFSCLAAVLKKPRRTVMINSVLISMDVIMLQTVP